MKQKFCFFFNCKAQRPIIKNYSYHSKATNYRITDLILFNCIFTTDGIEKNTGDKLKRYRKTKNKICLTVFKLKYYLLLFFINNVFQSNSTRFFTTVKKIKLTCFGIIYNSMLQISFVKYPQFQFLRHDVTHFFFAYLSPAIRSFVLQILRAYDSATARQPALLLQREVGDCWPLQ